MQEHNLLYGIKHCLSQNKMICDVYSYVPKVDFRQRGTLFRGGGGGGQTFQKEKKKGNSSFGLHEKLSPNIVRI